MRRFGSIFMSVASVVRSMRVTLPHLVGRGDAYKEMTEEYPDRLSARMPDDLPVRFRGFLTNNIEKCSGCKLCSQVCPVDCIRIETEPGPEPTVSWVSTFDIDHAKCMYCGFCVDVCPTRSLTHTRNYEGSVERLKDLQAPLGKGFATKEMKQRWLSEQMEKEAVAEELALLEKNPVGAELKRWIRQEEKKGTDK